MSISVNFAYSGQLVERLRGYLWNGRLDVNSRDGHIRRTVVLLLLATTSTFILNELCCPGAMTLSWAP